MTVPPNIEEILLMRQQALEKKFKNCKDSEMQKLAGRLDEISWVIEEIKTS